ncbi:MAG: helicase [Burkholderiales bacterium RIFCSPLOWO2_02_FULL_57_36]|nr:MAG: helicase [Burkholderiales bacterium RIFCSPLOWO2_02_FULL_57_36]
MAAVGRNPAPQRTIPPLHAEWINCVEQLAASAHGTATVASSGKPKKAPLHRLVFALTPVPYYQHPKIGLSICKARLRVNGEIAGTEPIYDLQRLLYNPPGYVAREDEENIRMLSVLHSGMQAYATYVEPEGKLGAHLLRMLLAENKLYWARSTVELYQGKLFLLGAGPARRAELVWQKEKSLLQLVWKLEPAERPIAAAVHEVDTIAEVLPTDPPLYIDGAMCGEVVLAQDHALFRMEQLQELVRRAPLLDTAHKETVARALLARGLHTVVPLPHELSITTRRDVRAEPVLVLDSAPYAANEYADFAQPAFLYSGQRCTPAVGDNAPAAITRQTAEGVEQIERDPAAERQALTTLAELGFMAPANGQPLSNVPGVLTLPTQAAWLNFEREHLARLAAQGWHIEKQPGYRFDLTEVDDWYAEIGDEADQPGNPWFDLELGVIVNNERISLLPVLVELIRHAPQDFNPDVLARHADSDEILASLPNGARVALPWGRIKPILNTLGELYFTDKTGSALRLSTLDAARLTELEGAAQLRWMGGQRVRSLGEKISRFGGVSDIAMPAGLQASLRSYQAEGVAWLQFLREYDLAGILADDMGLGKTIQTLAHILIEKEAGRLTQPALVVAPTSLMSNWQDEAARFAPSLRVLVLQGPERIARFEQIAQADIVLTTYALLPRDEDRLRAHVWHLVILDEAHYIKNARSKAAQVAGLLRARHRVCLTGTPLENHLGELWSQFHFLLPGLLGDDKTFNRDFRVPIEKHGDDPRRRLLMQRLKPFILRRTKDKVARELPAKTEMVRHIEISGAQRDLYETVRLAMDKKVRNEIAKKGVARSQIVILEALLKLRQVCCDPRLVKSSTAKKHTAPSAKLSDFLEMLEALLEDGRRILLFSQFTSMLALIEAELNARQIPYALLTGDTKDRAGAVRSFQKGQVPLFLISLKAGGVGLNLTAADTVIHYDPWWNPAAENQATDRAWRIGQDKPVFVYKLIAKGTLEEKIQALQQKKADLARAILDDGAAQNLKLTQEDLQAIFAPLAA